MIRIALCDDEKVFLSTESKIVSDYFTQKGLSYAVNCYLSGKSLLEDKSMLLTFDLIILDVEMDGIDGISVAKRIRESNDKVNIAFISAHMNYSTDGYRVKALRYILKDHNDFADYMHECLDCVLEDLDSKDRIVTFDFTIGKRSLKVNDIIKLNSTGNYTTFVLISESKESYKIRRPLKKTIESLNAFDFILISAKEAVNLYHVSSVTRYTVSLDDGSKL